MCHRSGYRQNRELTIRERNIVATLAHVGGARRRKVATLWNGEHTLRKPFVEFTASSLTGHFELYLYAKRLVWTGHRLSAAGDPAFRCGRPARRDKCPVVCLPNEG
jgi:hypothetical protein